MDPYSNIKHEYSSVKQEYSTVKHELASPPPGSTNLEYYRQSHAKASSAHAPAGDTARRESAYGYDYSQSPRAGYETTPGSSSYAYAQTPTQGYAQSYAKCADLRFQKVVVSTDMS